MKRGKMVGGNGEEVKRFVISTEGAIGDVAVCLPPKLGERRLGEISNYEL